MGTHQNRKRQRGNALVELALVFLPLMALLLAIIDFSLPIFLWSTFTHAAREGVRYGITYRTTGGLSHSESIKRVVQQQACGFLNGESGLARIKVRYYSPVTFAEASGPQANASGNIVEVSIEPYTQAWIAPLWRSLSPWSISVVSSDRLEVLPNGMERPVP
ncbi:MAG: TadE/TadG family type IV pilus assembly protein [Bryobacteraceae bacterium]